MDAPNIDEELTGDTVVMERPVRREPVQSDEPGDEEPTVRQLRPVLAAASGADAA